MDIPTHWDVHPASVISLCPLESWKNKSKIPRKKITLECYFYCSPKKPSVRWAVSAAKYGIASPLP